MEPPVRIELTTCRLQGGCSTTELERRVEVRNYAMNKPPQCPQGISE
jgi:hypothetical protein